MVGYRLTDEHSGRAAVYLPGVQRLTPEVREQLTDCSALLIDGTCWHDDELIRLGLAAKTSAAMGHLPIGGPDGSLEQLRRAARRAPDLRPHQQHQPRPAGGLPGAADGRSSTAWEVAVDGLEVKVS